MKPNACDSLPESVIELLRDAGAASAVASGQVHVLSVSPIRDALAERWPRREAGVSDFVLRSFHRSALADDLILRLNDVDFIVVQPSWSPLGALNRASQLMRETLSYFLGEARPENIRVAVVDDLWGDTIQARAITPPPAPSSPNGRGRLAAAIDGSPPWERFTVGAAASGPVLVRRPEGQDLEAFFYLEPIWNASAGAVASFLVQSVVVEVSSDGARLPPDYALFTPRCHLALTSRRIAFLQQMLEQAAAPLVAHLPISADCLRLASTRFWLLSDLKRRLGGELRRNVVIELCDLPDGFPASALSALVAQTAPYARAVLARFKSAGASARSRCGLNGLVRQVEGPIDDRLLAREVQAFADAARRLRLASGVHGLCSRRHVLIARAAGVTHISGPAIMEAVGSDAAPRRFRLEHLYGHGAEARAAVA